MRHVVRSQRRLITVTALLVLAAFAFLAIQAPISYADAGWTASYWDNPTLTGEPKVVRQEAALDHDWHGLSPDVTIPVDRFSARWITVVDLLPGTYRFSATTDDGMRVWVNDKLIIDAWYESPLHTITTDVAVGPGPQRIRVEYFEDGGNAVAKLTWSPISIAPGPGPMPPAKPGPEPLPPMQPPGAGAWQGEYFNNRSLSGTALVRQDAAVDFNWGYGSPAPQINPDNFSARWTRSVNLEPGRYRFILASDDGVRMWVNDVLIINAWFDHALQTFIGEANVAGGPTALRVEYFEASQLAEVHLSWQRADGGQMPGPDPMPPGKPGTGGPGTGGPMPTAVVTASYLNMRYGPGVDHFVLGKTTKGAEVSLVSRNQQATWVEIVTPGGVRGWVNARYLTTDYPYHNLPVAGATEKPVPMVTVTTNWLNVRTGPGLGYPAFTAIPRGQTVVTVGAAATRNWIKIKLPNGQDGWVSAQLVTSNVPVRDLPVVG